MMSECLNLFEDLMIDIDRNCVDKLYNNGLCVSRACCPKWCGRFDTNAPYILPSPKSKYNLKYHWFVCTAMKLVLVSPEMELNGSSRTHWGWIFIYEGKLSDIYHINFILWLRVLSLLNSFKVWFWAHFINPWLWCYYFLDSQLH